MILDQIVEKKKERLILHKERIPDPEMRKLAETAVKIQKPWNHENEEEIPFGIGKENDTEEGAGLLSAFRGEYRFLDQIKKAGISVIGECKKASPSLGDITAPVDLEQRIREYNDSVDAISCLTEEDYFKGDIRDLLYIRKRTPLPILRKDFMIDEYQFYEARVIGADAVLLIAAILDDGQMRDFYQLAKELELDVLVETHDEREVERALKLNPDIIGINNRNLADFSISLETTRRLRKMLPEDQLLVAESGILTEKDVAFLKEQKVDAFLIGRALMESEKPGEVVKRWKGSN